MACLKQTTKEKISQVLKLLSDENTQTSEKLELKIKPTFSKQIFI